MENIKRKILVVDDDDNLRNVLLDKLTMFGFETQGAINGEDGLKKAFESHPDVIMLDVLMPKMDGWQVLEKLRADEWGKKAKVVMLTSLGQMDTIATAVSKKVFTYIVKSDLKLDELPSIIEGVMKNPLG